MKIYFAASIRGGRKDADLYLKIIRYLKNFGEVLTEHIGDKNLEETGEKNMSDTEIHDRDMNWLRESDIIFAEVTTPSLGVGYEIGRALEIGKRVVCIYRESEGKRLSAMLGGTSELELYYYKNLEEAKALINNLFGI